MIVQITISDSYAQNKKGNIKTGNINFEIEVINRKSCKYCFAITNDHF